jgi:hypothetical protein
MAWTRTIRPGPGPKKTTRLKARDGTLEWDPRR